MKAFLIVLLLFLAPNIFAQFNDYEEIWIQRTTKGDSILPATALSNGYYLSAVKLPDSLYGATTLKIKVGVDANTLNFIANAGDTTYTITGLSGKWLKFQPTDYYPFKWFQPILNVGDSSVTPNTWKFLGRKY